MNTYLEVGADGEILSISRFTSEGHVRANPAHLSMSGLVVAVVVAFLTRDPRNRSKLRHRTLARHRQLPTCLLGLLNAVGREYKAHLQPQRMLHMARHERKLLAVATSFH